MLKKPTSHYPANTASTTDFCQTNKANKQDSIQYHHRFWNVICNLINYIDDVIVI